VPKHEEHGEAVGLVNWGSIGRGAYPSVSTIGATAGSVPAQ